MQFTRTQSIGIAVHPMLHKSAMPVYLPVHGLKFFHGGKHERFVFSQLATHATLDRVDVFQRAGLFVIHCQRPDR